MIVLFASVRRGGKTLGQMVKEEIGPGRRRARADQRPGDHDHFARGAGAGGRASAGEKSVGRFHHRDDDSRSR